MTDDVLIYDATLPARIEPYEIAAASVRRHDRVAFVCDVLLPPDIEQELFVATADRVMDV